MNWWVIIATFVAVNLDFFCILIFLLQRYRFRDVAVGYLLGVELLITLSYFVGRLLSIFLPEWLLGVLGILPIWMALHDNDEEPGKQGHQNGIWSVFTTYLAVCSGCNLSIFLPVLTGIDPVQFLAVMLVIGICTVLITGLIKVVGDLPIVKHFMSKYSEILMKIVYIGVGLYVFWDSGLISHLLKLL